MLSTNDVQELIEKAIPDATCQVQDLTGTSDHFAIRVSSKAFAGRSHIEQRKMVHQALGEHLTTTIHAVDIKIHVPD